MAGTEQESGTDEQWVHLHMALDPNNEAERRFGQLFEGLPNGMKTHFCKSLLIDAIPDTEEGIDLLIAKLIRQKRFALKRRGRPTKKNRAPSPAPVAAPAAAPAAASAAKAASTEKAVASSAGNMGLQDFTDLAGGGNWNDKGGVKS